MNNSTFPELYRINVATIFEKHDGGMYTNNFALHPQKESTTQTD